jgi:non-ribosomal peptide synthetase component E (peptide arylation enzyme)
MDRGVKKGHMVAVSLGNNWEFAVVTYALFKLGAILVHSFPFYDIHRGQIDLVENPKLT